MRILYRAGSVSVFTVGIGIRYFFGILTSISVSVLVFQNKLRSEITTIRYFRYFLSVFGIFRYL